MLQMAPYPLDKQTAICNSPHDRLMSLAMDLATFCYENSTNGCHLAVFSEDVAFAHHFVANCLSLSSHPVGVLNNIRCVTDCTCWRSLD